MKNKYFYSIFFLLLITLFAWPAFGADTTSQKALEITRITPKGNDVPPGRQIVIQFNRPVVPLGRMARTHEEIPINISPELKGQWRWLNTSALAYQLDEKEALKYATRYEVTINPGITAEDGATIEKPYTHKFITQRPVVTYAWFKTWLAPGMPVLRLTFNQSVTGESVEKHLFLTLGKTSKERIYLIVEPDPDDEQQPRYLPLPGEGLIADFGESEPVQSDDDPQKVNGVEARRIWLAKPIHELPLETMVRLNIEPGLVSALGPEKGITGREIVRFDTFPEFEFIGISCQTNENNSILIRKDEPLESQIKCNPLRSVALVFSAPVINEEVKNHVTFTPDLAGGRKDYDPWENRPGYSRLRESHRKGQMYEVRLPEFLQAWQKYTITADAATIKDEFGRPLEAPIDFSFFTDHRKPDFNLIHKTAVLEKGVDTRVPLVVTNLDEVTLNYKKLTSQNRETNLTAKSDVPEAKDVAFPIPLGVRDALNGESGAVFGQVSTKPHVDKHESEYTFFAQVTPYNVHVKLGHFNTLVWVTDFATGRIVPDAKVTIYKDTMSELAMDKLVLSEAKTDENGIAMLDGTQSLDPKLETLKWCYNDFYHCSRLFVRIEKDNDLALLPLDYRYRIDTYRVSKYSVYSSMKKDFGHIHAWGTTAQGVYRAGDTIQYKFYVRNQDNQTFVTPPKEGYTLTIIDPTGKSVQEIKDISLSEFGAYDGEYSVPKTGAVGWYQFKLSAKFTEYSWQPMQVLVSDFTPSPFRVTNEINGDLFHQDDEATLTTYAKLHAGGPYIEASTRITARLSSGYFSSKDPIAKGFFFNTYTPESRQTYTIFQETKMLDDKGALESRFILPDKGIIYGRLTIESAVQDDRGKYVASSTSADYVGRDRFIGLKHTRWVYEEDKTAKVEYLVVDELGKPVSDVDVRINIDRLETKASRVKGAGNAYLTQYIDEWIPVQEESYLSKNKPGTCKFTPPDPGSYRIIATITDTKGREHSTQIVAWVAGKGRVLWREPDDNSLQIIPENETGNVGDTARFLIKNPFPGAVALVSIERYGVIKQWTQLLESSTPIIEFPITPDYLPGVYLSVIVTSPRVEKPMGEGNVDLGKPAFRIGYVPVPVKDPYKEILVEVKPEKEKYKPGDTVTVDLKAYPRHPDKEEPIELAVVVLDEAVFDLLSQGRSYYDPYNGFYRLDGLDVQNYSLLTRLVGRQKFEKKGASAGGDGGAAISMRSVFKFVSYWNPSLKTDKKGRAHVEFKVPDNLTGWRIFAMAITPGDRMGLGDAGFKVNRPTEIRPVMPNQLTEGDSFKAGFSVMNRTDKERTLTVKINVSGSIDEALSPPDFETKIELSSYKRTTVFMPVQTSSAGPLDFKITAQDKIDGDGLVHNISVNKRRSLETAANYGSTTVEKATEVILFPEKMHADVGSISVVAAPTVIGNIEGAFRYMKNYPYTCWEQLLSKGAMAAHYTSLKDYIPDTFSWQESTMLPEATLAAAADFQAPNGGMVYFIPRDMYVSPYLSAYTALAFNWLRKDGYEIPAEVEKKLHAYLENLLRKDVFPSFYSKGMSSTVRAVALAALSEHGKISRADLDRYFPHVDRVSLFGKAHYLMAALNVKGTETIIQDVTDRILGHASQSGGKFSFNELLDDSYSRILATPMRDNAAILTAFTQLANTEGFSEKLGDIPFKLVRMMTQTRGNRDHWENTQENMFCMNALIDYSRVYEKDKPKMTVRVLADANLLGETQFMDLRDDAVTFERPIADSDPGKRTEITINREGTGRLYYATRVSFAPLEDYAERTNAGIDIRREYSVERNGEWLLLKSPMEIKRSELVRVDIFLSLPTARNFVVVNDPVPGGLEPVNRDLATASEIDAGKGDFTAAGGSWWFEYSDWYSYNVSRWSFYHKELRHDSVRFYSDYLPAGNYHLSYTAQAIAEGKFSEMPVHAEEMYDPDVFGKGLPGTLIVNE